MPSSIRFSLLLSVCLSFASCYAPLRVKKVTPPVPTAHVVSASDLKAASKLSRRAPFASTAQILDSLRRTYESLVAGDASAIPEYNYLTARLVEQVRGLGIKPWQNMVSIPSPNTQYILRGSQPDDLDVTERHFVASDSVVFKGKYASKKAIGEGVGAPLLAILSSPRTEFETFDKNFRYRNVTAIVTFEGDAATIDLVDPYDSETIRFGGHSYPLHVDFGLNISYGLSEARIDKLGIARLLNPRRYDATANLNRIQPYDPKRIPVLFVHGLQDTPASFVPMYIDLMADPDIREKYQFWIFSYPSGYPFPYSASLLRRELDRVSHAFPGHKDIVIIGHSMGGLLTRLMLTDSDDEIWSALFDNPVPTDTTHLRESERTLINSMVFDSRSDVDRAIFISTPHRGSVLATNWIGRIGSRLIKLPNLLADTRDSVVNIVSLDSSGKALDRVPNSIDTLSPKSRFVIEMNKIPIDPNIPHHSIMGDRGKGDTPNSSDGVVAYWSSHVETVETELIVPSNHSAHQNDQGIEEVRRILRAHAGIK